jgi:hypothetical protein
MASGVMEGIKAYHPRIPFISHLRSFKGGQALQSSHSPFLECLFLNTFNPVIFINPQHHISPNPEQAHLRLLDYMYVDGRSVYAKNRLAFNGQCGQHPNQESVQPAWGQ